MIRQLKMCLITRVFAVLFFALALNVSSYAQGTLGAITGTVKDASSATVPGATVRATNLGTNLEVSSRRERLLPDPEPSRRNLQNDLHKRRIQTQTNTSGHVVTEIEPPP